MTPSETLDIIACNKCMIVADYGIGGQNYSRVIVIAIADINSAVAIQQAVRETLLPVILRTAQSSTVRGCPLPPHTVRCCCYPQYKARWYLSTVNG